MGRIKETIKHTSLYKHYKGNQIKRKSGKLPQISFSSRCENRSDSFLDKNKVYKRIAVVACFAKEGYINDSLIFYLDALNKFVDGIVLIGDSPVVPSELEKVKNKVLYYQFDRHCEYDFGSYKRGYIFLKENGLLNDLDELLLTNDSAFGPIYDISNIVDNMSSSENDFWGLLLANQLQPHLQSWFIMLKKPVIESKCLEDFLMSVKKEKYQWDVVTKYEINFTPYLVKNGFKYAAVYDANEFVSFTGGYNPMIFSGNLLEKYNFPFVKAKVFTEFFCQADQRVQTVKYVKEHNEELYNIIIDHLMLNNCDTYFLKKMEEEKKKPTYEELLIKIAEMDLEIKRVSAENIYMKASLKWKVASLIAKICKAPFRVFFNKKNSVEFKKSIPYYSEYQEDMDFSSYQTTIKTLAFYLPQFHEFEENNKWWGKGFTEWVNAKKAKPLFENHYQPRLPHDDIGFYDLSDYHTLQKQAELAKRHGIYGFIFYYYWFSGKKLMDLPINLLLQHKEIDLPFCLCWANENWTRRWDGQNKDILIAQDYSERDPEMFIKDLKMYIDDGRYIRINGKPLIMIYNPYEIPHINDIILRWKKEAIKQGIGEIYIATRNVMFSNKITLSNADAEFDFPPVYHAQREFLVKTVAAYSCFDYFKAIDVIKLNIKKDDHIKPYFYTSTMGWDNTSRRKNNAFIFYHYDIEKFYDWNKAIVENLKKKPESERFLLVNAWNEWCEGTYLEPDKKYGYAAINTLSKAIFEIPFNDKIVSNIHNDFKLPESKKIAVHVHLFYLDLVDEIIKQTNNIPYDFDIFISTDSNKKRIEILEKFSRDSKAKNIEVKVFKNRGRDVLPFISQIKKHANEYDYVCHIHSKKSKFAKYGDNWREYLYNNLFGNPGNVSTIFEEFEKSKNVGLIYPEVYKEIADQVGDYNGNYEHCKKLFKILDLPVGYLNRELVFPAGTMFWAKVDAIKPLFSKKLSAHKFEKEKSQINCTLAHAVERSLCSIACSQGYAHKEIKAK